MTSSRRELAEGRQADRDAIASRLIALPGLDRRRSKRDITSRTDRVLRLPSVERGRSHYEVTMASVAPGRVGDHDGSSADHLRGA